MKVLIVHPHMSFYGGAETVVINLAKELRKMGVENSVLTLSLSDEIADMHREITFITPPRKYVLKLQDANLLNSIKRLSGEIMMLNRLIKQNSQGFDIVNVHNFPATWAMLFTGCKNVVWMCNEPPDLWNKESPSLALKILWNAGYGLDKFIVNKVVQKICAADEINADRIRRRYGRDVEIVPYGIDYDLFCSGSKQHILEKYNLNGRFILAQVGTITPQKNQMESVKAVNILRKRIPNIYLLLVGSGDNNYQNSIMDYIEKNNLKDYVLFVGHRNRREISDIYHASDAALFPVKEQGGWLAPFEAMCALVPVVVSETMGAASIVKREGLGIVAQNYADAVFDIYRNPSAYREKTIVSKEWVKNNLTWANFAKRNLQIFESLIKHRGGKE